MKILSIFALVILTAFLLAEGLEPEGLGTEDSPYLVQSLDNLLWISTNDSSWESCFEQVADIDATDSGQWNNGEGFSPIGWWTDNSNNFAFSGSYKGNFKEILNLQISRESQDAVGLFGYIQGASITGLALESVNICGDDFVGGIAGYNLLSEIDNCYVGGNISGQWCAGLLVGFNCAENISYCHTAGTVAGHNNVGGLIGLNSGDYTLNCCSSEGEVNGLEKVGGLAGYNQSSDICGCYTTAAVNGWDHTGGFVGYNWEGYIHNCYCTGAVSSEMTSGGFAGYNDNIIADSFWNRETSCQNLGVGCNPEGQTSSLFSKTSSEMRDQNTYLNRDWDFWGDETNGSEGTWIIAQDDNDGYPYTMCLTWAIFYHSIHAWFQAEPLHIELGEPVEFLARCAGDILLYEWDFDNDDLIDSNQENPVWIYDQTGIFTVSLRVSEPGGDSHTLRLDDYITVVYTGDQPAGTGTEEDPYQISSLENLVWASSMPQALASCMVQTSDINAAASRYLNQGAGFASIGNQNLGSFQGKYFGNGHQIDSLYINRPFDYGVAFLGDSYGAEIHDLALTNIDITGGEAVAAIAGSYHDSMLISNCTISGKVSGNSYLGAICPHPIYVDLQNSYYNREEFLINGEYQTGVGALNSNMYHEWLAHAMQLDIDDYLQQEAGEYLLADIADLEAVSAFLNQPDLHLRLTNDIDLYSNPGFFLPFFKGVFQGNGYQISNLRLDLPTVMVLGFLGYLENAVVNDLKICAAWVDGLSAGALAGVMMNSDINNCYAEGMVSGDNYTGMMFGDVYGSHISNCGCSGQLTMSLYCGGLAGFVCCQTLIEKSYSTCDVEGNFGAGSFVGVITEAQIQNCYSTGDVYSLNNAGGFCGRSHNSLIVNCYASGRVEGDEDTAGFIVAVHNGEIVDCLWNQETSQQQQGVGDNDGGIIELTACTSAEMLEMNTYTSAGWDFVGEDENGTEDIWDIGGAATQEFAYLAGSEWVDEETVELSLLNNEIRPFPNPFNPEITIDLIGDYATKQQNDLKMCIYNIKGQRVADWIINKEKNKIVWNADTQPAGIYIVALTDGGKLVSSKKITLIK